MDNPIFMKFVTVTIFSLMFAIGVNHSYDQLTSLWRRPDLLLRSLLAVVVLVPLVAVAILWLFALPPAVATGLAVLASAPGAPLTTKRAQMAAGDPYYAASLQLMLVLLAVVATPLTLAIFNALFDLSTESVAPFKIARQVGEVTFLPVVIGLLLQRFAPRVAKVIAKPVRMLANILFVLLFVLIGVMLAFVPNLRQMLNLGAMPIVAIIVMGGLAIAMGHLLGGPSEGQRSSLAIACIARNAGLALFIAALSDYGQQFVPTLLAYLLVGAVVAVPYSVWRKHRMKGKDTP